MDVAGESSGCGLRRSRNEGLKFEDRKTSEVVARKYLSQDERFYNKEETSREFSPRGQLED